MRNLLLITVLLLMCGCAPSTIIYDDGRGLSAQDQKSITGPLFSDRTLARKALKDFLDKRHKDACNMLDGQVMTHDYMGAQFSVLAMYDRREGGTDFGIDTASPGFNASLDMNDCAGDADLAAANALLDFMRRKPGVAASLQNGEVTLHDFAGTSYAIADVHDKMAGAHILLAAEATGPESRGQAYAPKPESWTVVKGPHKLSDFYLPGDDTGKDGGKARKPDENAQEDCSGA